MVLVLSSFLLFAYHPKHGRDVGVELETKENIGVVCALGNLWGSLRMARRFFEVLTFF